jgi:hypothetical protein
MNQAAERIESLKAGIIGSIAAGIGFGVAEMAVHLGAIALKISHPVDERFFLISPFSVSLSISPFLLWVVVQSAIVLLSGFLFGVTYRYVVRQNANPQLKAGAMLAFGLVRGLAQVGEMTQVEPIWAGVRILESLWLFVVAGFVLDWAIQRGWVQSFRE